MRGKCYLDTEDPGVASMVEMSVVKNEERD